MLTRDQQKWLEILRKHYNTYSEFVGPGATVNEDLQDIYEKAQLLIIEIGKIIRDDFNSHPALAQSKIEKLLKDNKPILEMRQKTISQSSFLKPKITDLIAPMQGIKDDLEKINRQIEKKSIPKPRTQEEIMTRERAATVAAGKNFSGRVKTWWREATRKPIETEISKALKEVQKIAKSASLFSRAAPKEPIVFKWSQLEYNSGDKTRNNPITLRSKVKDIINHNLAYLAGQAMNHEVSKELQDLLQDLKKGINNLYKNQLAPPLHSIDNGYKKRVDEMIESIDKYLKLKQPTESNDLASNKHHRKLKYPHEFYHTLASSVSIIVGKSR